MKRSWTALFVVVFLALAVLRLPSLVQPSGNDQGLYAYVGQQVARGGVPYRDAWDQKPPGIHLAYAVMYTIWPHDPVVPATDLLAAVAAALLLVALGRRLSERPGAGEAAALLFLLLGNPSFQRLSGMYVRAQCETYIGVLAVAALLLVVTSTIARERGDRLPRTGGLFAAGLALGAIFLFKYNAGVYAGAAAFTVPLMMPPRGPSRRTFRPVVNGLLWLSAGFAVPVAITAVWIAHAGAFHDLIAATIDYNVRYSGETYGGAAGFATYLATFPVRHAGIDSLWLLGGAGSTLLVVTAPSTRRHLVAPMWVAAACLSIAINGSRGLPQYFVQALPLLALAAGLALCVAWSALGLALRAALAIALTIAVARVASFDKLADNTWRDLQYARGAIARTDYLSQFASARTSAAAVYDLADFLHAKTAESDRVFVFGFSGNAYVRAGRVSASRFFWSRPVLVGFNDGQPGYGAAGLLKDLAASRPPLVVLQMHDWPAEGIDSATFFLQHPQLGPWLRSGYELTAQNASYMIWSRRAGA
jgi:hypothetical protein